MTRGRPKKRKRTEASLESIDGALLMEDDGADRENRSRTPGLFGEENGLYADGGKRFTDGVDGDVDEDGSMLAWTVEEKEELLLNILTYLSSLRKDNLSYRRRLQRFEWEAVVTNSRSAGECQNQWTDMAKKVRSYRVMAELVTDALETIKVDKENNTHIIKTISRRLRTNGYKKPEHPGSFLVLATVPRKARNKCRRLPEVQLAVQHTDYPRYPHSTANSFVLFQRKVWTERVAQGKRWSRRELTAGVAAKYAALPKAEKDELSAEAQKSKDEYEYRLQEFYEKHPEFNRTPSCPRSSMSSSFTGTTNLSFSRKEGSPERDRSPPTPLECFVRKKTPGEAAQMRSKPVVKIKNSRMWKQLSDTEKIGYIEESLDRHTAFNKAFEEPGSPIEKKAFATLDLSAVDRKLLFDSSISGEFRPEVWPYAHTGYALFCMEYNDRLRSQDQASKEWMARASEEWKTMDRRMKEGFADRVRGMWLAYENAAARFLDTVPVEEQDRMRARIKPTPNHISGKVRKKPSNPFNRNRKVRSRSPKNMGVVDGSFVFIMQNERDFRASFPHLNDKQVHRRLLRLFNDLPESAKRNYEGRSRHLEDVF